MKRGLMVFSVLSLLVGGVATASVQKGDTELDAMLSFVTENGANESDGAGDFQVWSLSGSFGYFLTDNVRVGAVGMWASIDNDSVALVERDIDLWAIGASVKYHFMPTNQWVPYVGGQVLYASVDIDLGFDSGDADGVLWGPVAGLRYELNANNDFVIEYQYHIWSGDIGDDVFDDGHAIFAGIVHQFK